jgi:hypothetical protein
LPADIFSQKDTIPGSGFFKGFVIKYGGDTIRGSVLNPGRNDISNTVYFRNRETRSEKFDPFQLSGFGTYSPGKVYKAIEVPTMKGPELSFVRILFEGNYSLLYYKSFTTEHFLIRDPIGKITDLNENLNVNSGGNHSEFSPINDFNLNLKIAFADNPGILSGNNAVKLRKESLINLLRSYYDNLGVNYVNYSGYGRKYYLGIVLGTSFDRFIPNSTTNDLKSFSRYYPYAGFHILATNIYTGLGVSLQNTFGMKSYHYHYSRIVPTGTVYNESFIKSFISTTRTGFSYESVAKKNVRPYFEGGPALTVMIEPDFENYSDIVLTPGSLGFSYHDHKRMSSTLFYGAFLRGGVSVNTKRLNYLRLSIGYDYFMNNGNDRINSIDLSVAYRLKFKK